MWTTTRLQVLCTVSRIPTTVYGMTIRCPRSARNVIRVSNKSSLRRYWRTYSNTRSTYLLCILYSLALIVYGTTVNGEPYHGKESNICWWIPKVHLWYTGSFISWFLHAERPLQSSTLHTCPWQHCGRDLRFLEQRRTSPRATPTALRVSPAQYFV